jgi:hypothetical protein
MFSWLLVYRAVNVLQFAFSSHLLRHWVDDECHLELMISKKNTELNWLPSIRGLALNPKML